MIIIMLAGAMTIAMLIATAFALHHEAQHAQKTVAAKDNRRPFGTVRSR